jgi:hypothetical protein
MRFKRTSTLIAAVAGALALAGTASAQGTVLSGKTAEGVKVKLEVAEFGNATAFTIGKIEVGCNRGGTLTTRKTTYTDFDTSDPGAFTGKFADNSKSGGFRFRTTTSVSGTAAADGTTWSGPFKSKTKVLKHGQKIDTCRLSTTWDAS